MFKEYVSENHVHIYLCTCVAFSKLEFLYLMTADSWGEIINTLPVECEVFVSTPASAHGVSVTPLPPSCDYQKCVQML